MALGTVVRDVYTNDERRTMYETLRDLLRNPNWSTAGLYCYWDPDTNEALYIGLSKNLPSRFAQHNSLSGTPGKGNKALEINDWFETHNRLGFSLVIQDAIADDAYGRYSANAEGQLIEGYRGLHGKFPPWNKIGGSKDGAKFADTDTAAWFDFMTGKADGLLVARRTIRELNDDATADFNEADIHMSRTALNFHAVNGKFDDAIILAGLKAHRATAAQWSHGLAIDNFDELHHYLAQPAPHPEHLAPRALTVDEQAERTAQWNRECALLADMRASVEKEFPELSTANVDLFFAQLVIGNHLGEDWVERNIDAASEGKERRTKTNTYLRRDPVDPMQRHERYIRVMELARRLFEFGPEDFAGRLRDNLRLRDLEGAAFEADVVRMLVSLPVVIDLRKENGEKGDDYDIDVWLTPSTPWAIEAKTRLESSPYTAKHLHKTLDRARSQLPPNGIGGIFMKVPTPWTTDSDYLDNHEAEVSGFLDKTSRVHIVVLVWDVWTPKSSGNGWNWGREHRIFKSPRIDPHLSTRADFYQRIWDNPHDLIAPTAPF